MDKIKHCPFDSSAGLLVPLKISCMSLAEKDLQKKWFHTFLAWVLLVGNPHLVTNKKELQKNTISSIIVTYYTPLQLINNC